MEMLLKAQSHYLPLSPHTLPFILKALISTHPHKPTQELLSGLETYILQGILKSSIQYLKVMSECSKSQKIDVSFSKPSVLPGLNNLVSSVTLSHSVIQEVWNHAEHQP